MVISKFTALAPLGYYTFLYRISAIKNIYTFIKKVENMI